MRSSQRRRSCSASCRPDRRSRSPRRSPPRRGDARPLVADLNAVVAGDVARVAAALAEQGLETVDGSISGPPPRCRRGRRGSTSRGRVRPRSRRLPLDGGRARRRRRRGRARVRREDVHRVGLQGAGRAPRAGAPHRAGVRRRRACPRRPRRDRARGQATDGRDDREGVCEGMALRAGDGGDRRDPGRSGPHARALPRDRRASTPSSPSARSRRRPRTSRTTSRSPRCSSGSARETKAEAARKRRDEPRHGVGAPARRPRPRPTGRARRGSRSRRPSGTARAA